MIFFPTKERPIKRVFKPSDKPLVKDHPWPTFDDEDRLNSIKEDLEKSGVIMNIN